MFRPLYKINLCFYSLNSKTAQLKLEPLAKSHKAQLKPLMFVQQALAFSVLYKHLFYCASFSVINSSFLSRVSK